MSSGYDMSPLAVAMFWIGNGPVYGSYGYWRDKFVSGGDEESFNKMLETVTV